MVRVDQVLVGIVWGLFVWPDLRQALMDGIFCNPLLTNDFSESILFGLGFCNYAFLLFFIIMPIITVVSYLPYIRKFISLIQDFIDWIQDIRG